MRYGIRQREQGKLKMEIIRTTGRFEHEFRGFISGIDQLKALSMSAAQAIGSAVTESDVVSRLATNVALDRPFGNGEGWGQCSIEVSATGVTYTTRGGLSFGWSVYSGDYQQNRELYPGERSNLWTFFVQHPLGEKIPNNSSLRKTAYQKGWLEVFSDNSKRLAKPLPQINLPWFNGTKVCLKNQGVMRENWVPFEPMYWLDKDGNIVAESYRAVVDPHHGQYQSAAAVCVYQTRLAPPFNGTRIQCTILTEMDGIRELWLAQVVPQTGTPHLIEKLDGTNQPLAEALLNALLSEESYFPTEEEPAWVTFEEETFDDDEDDEAYLGEKTLAKLRFQSQSGWFKYDKDEVE